MDKTAKHAFLLTGTEFMVLLTIAGARKVYSFRLPAKEDVGREELLLAMHQLAKRELLEADGRPVILPVIRPLIEAVCAPEKILTVLPLAGGSQAIIYFRDGLMVLTGPEATDGRIRITDVSEAELYEFLFEDGQAARFLNWMGGSAAADRAGMPGGSAGARSRINTERIAEEEYERMRGQGMAELDEPLTAWENCREAQAVWEIVRPGMPDRTARAVFMAGTPVPWLYLQTRGTSEILADGTMAGEKLRQWVMGRENPGED